MPLRFSLRAALFGLLLATVAGCSRSSGFTVAENVEGTVTLDGVPLAGVRVTFVPQLDPKAKAPSSSAVTDRKGHFRLERDDNHQRGAVVGRHRVTVYPGRPEGARERGDDSSGGDRLPQFPTTYLSASQSPLIVEVKADRTDYPLRLTRRGR